MFDMMLGPLGQTFWYGSAAMPRASFHHDWSRVVFQAAATTNPLDAFSYGIGTANPAAIVAAFGAAVQGANILDTSIGKADSLSRSCIATHLGVKLDSVCLRTPAAGADIVLTAVATRQVLSRLAIRVFYAERPNEEFVGKFEDLPDGKGVNYAMPNAPPNIQAGVTNGWPSFDNIRPLPQPLPFEGGVTYFRVTFEPSRRGNGAAANGITCAAVTSLRAEVYGVAPPRGVPTEATQTALAALASLR